MRRLSRGAALLLTALAAYARAIPRPPDQEGVLAPESGVRAASNGHPAGILGGWNPYGYPYPPAPPHTFAEREGCAFSGQTRRIAFVHVGKTGGSALHTDLVANGINCTEFEMNQTETLKADLADYDTFIVTTRDPLDRVVSAFNFEHPIGGGDPEMRLLVDENRLRRPEHDIPLQNNGAWFFNVYHGLDLPPYFVPNATEAPLTTPADYMTYSGAVPTGPKPLSMHMFIDCFPELPGGVNKFAESLDGDSNCSQLARRVLHESKETSHMNNGYVLLFRDTGLLERMNTTDSKTAYFSIKQGAKAHDAHDEADLWDWLCVENPSSDGYGVTDDFERHDDTALSELGYATLKRSLADEYDAFNRFEVLDAQQREGRLPRMLQLRDRLRAEKEHMEEQAGDDSLQW